MYNFQPGAGLFVSAANLLGPGSNAELRLVELMATRPAAGLGVDWDVDLIHGCQRCREYGDVIPLRSKDALGRNAAYGTILLRRNAASRPACINILDRQVPMSENVSIVSFQFLIPSLHNKCRARLSTAHSQSYLRC